MATPKPVRKRPDMYAAMLGAADIVIAPTKTMKDPINMPMRRPYLSDAGPPKGEPTKFPVKS
jgi:hypothetical protein